MFKNEIKGTEWLDLELYKWTPLSAYVGHQKKRLEMSTMWRGYRKKKNLEFYFGKIRCVWVSTLNGVHCTERVFFIWWGGATVTSGGCVFRAVFFDFFCSSRAAPSATLRQHFSEVDSLPFFLNPFKAKYGDGSIDEQVSKIECTMGK